jgi:hypothetical protein
MKKLIVFLTLFLVLSGSSAIAQEAWYEAAESSCAGYRVDSAKSKEIKGVKLGEDIERMVEEMHPNSNFAIKGLHGINGRPAGGKLPSKIQRGNIISSDAAGVRCPR